ncbi:hypothetical protein FOXG_22277 [Fusarium oxysporum f. sp. lycopersici 4287]|uniref:Uncharacterized protein n=2 Tax=Fusarium oxysporum TaxID=5507 RepID=A0A0J9W737_FUSO4|nr:hypothetical protein FOXG_22277 [Fusarium oxysporum f. sp. lycopersici 4287]EXK26503.1 hypothetical protein FOMG_16907 [Fusarium oxysporum f. sp. melonis 26406]KNB18550.1 hypothetical protein FOXG_22277 [Fusarium oxysporum f. sp. lycopersici 4287]
MTGLTSCEHLGRDFRCRCVAGSEKPIGLVLQNGLKDNILGSGRIVYLRRGAILLE